MEEGATVTDGSNAGNTNAAMNLFEKYSSLNRGIDEAREEMKQTRLKIEEINQSIEKTQQERDSMQHDTTVAYEEANDFHRQVDEAYEDLSKLQSERSRVLMEKQEAERELEGVKSFVEEHRRQFLEQSREFRASCKRVRLRANDLGLEYAPLRAFATVISDPAISGEWNTEDESKSSPRSVLPRDFQEDERSFYHPATMPDAHTSTANGEYDISASDPNKWIADPRDEEMKEALERYREEHEQHEKEKQSLEHLKGQNMTMKDQANKRAERKETSLSQLNRLSNEIKSLENEIAEQEQFILEAKQMSQSYEKNAKSIRNKIAQRRFEEGLTSTSNAQPLQTNTRPSNQQRSTNGTAIARPTQNPYAKKQQSGNRSNGTNGKRTSSNSIANTQQARPRPQSHRTSYNKNQQHPHRVGHVRMGRKFTTNLETVGGDEVLEEVDHEAAHRSSGTADGDTTGRANLSMSLLDDSDDDDALLANPF